MPEDLAVTVLNIGFYLCRKTCRYCKAHLCSILFQITLLELFHQHSRICWLRRLQYRPVRDRILNLFKNESSVLCQANMWVAYVGHRGTTCSEKLQRLQSDCSPRLPKHYIRVFFFFFPKHSVIGCGHQKAVRGMTWKERRKSVGCRLQLKRDVEILLYNPAVVVAKIYSLF